MGQCAAMRHWSVVVLLAGTRKVDRSCSVQTVPDGYFNRETYPFKLFLGSLTCMSTEFSWQTGNGYNVCPFFIKFFPRCAKNVNEWFGV